ncbi:zinc-binding alcohol dehydrogenase family protein [Paraburkholderia sp. 22B1P]|jgi:NADPH:quinone reductase-like Zn-dependent oxidoreductase|uniref:quinone oxidoreductase family protein n=1 Tax=Paraburkholderia sp. 22B1P TaxID=3080498 RepID=UPI0030870E67|nr:zinc-binding alcohol dehydrogenase family protein [Paraburkholderia sp. 22B1P]
MKAAVVTQAGQMPVYAEFEAPVAEAGHVLIDVEASALSHVTRAKASGAHYSATGRFPFVAGIDGVGRREDGKRVYFFGPKEPAGGLAQRTLVPEAQCFIIPETLDPVTAAAMAIPGMSSWAALTERAKFVAGETVLINGATGASGRLAVQIAKHLGAANVIATGRHPQALSELKALGADHVVPLDQDEAALHRAVESHFRAGVDVVLDYLWGPSAQALLTGAARSLPDGYPMRFVQIGSIGGATLELPGAVLRASAISLLGSGIGSVPFERLLLAISEVLHAALAARLDIATQAVPLAELATHWQADAGRARTVFTMRP